MLLEVPDSDMPWLLLVLQYVSLRLPDLWPLMSPPHPLGQWTTIHLNLCEESPGETDNVQARATNMVRVEHTGG